MRAPALGAKQPVALPGAYSYKVFVIQRPAQTPTSISMRWDCYFQLLRQSRLNPRAFAKVVHATVSALKATGYAGCLSKAVLKALKAPQV